VGLYVGLYGEVQAQGKVVVEKYMLGWEGTDLF